MRWTDGSVYRGSWDKGVQHGIGIMAFPNGMKRIGFFEQNEFERPLSGIGEYDGWLDSVDPETAAAMPHEFREEARAYF
jgi:hypothetical protein